MILRLLVCGLGLIAVGLVLFLPTLPSLSQDSIQDRDFVGAGDCQDCHSSIARDLRDSAHTLTLQEVERNQSNILAAFDQGDDVRMVQFPGEDAPRPFTADDIAYTIGAGRYVQRYLYEVERRVYAVLPAEWDTVNQVWRPYLLADTWPAPEYDWFQSCAGCHTTGLDLERGSWEDDGVQCEACHGPGSEHVEAVDDAGRRPDDEEIAQIHAAIVVSPDAQICGQCHSQGMQADTAHPYPTQYRPGLELVSESGFQLLPEDDPAVWFATGHGRLNNMQYNEWLHSSHAGSLETLRGSASAEDGCVTCHAGDTAFIERLLAAYDSGDLSGEPPPPTALDNAQSGITCVTCHSPHGAAEEVSFIDDAYTLCTSCHRNTELIQPIHHPVAEMFEGQPIIDSVAGVPSAHFAAEDAPTCVTCHMTEVAIGGAGETSTTLASHTWIPVIPGASDDSPPNVCADCHEDLLTSDLRSLIEDTQAAVRNRLLVARARVDSLTIPDEGTEEREVYDQITVALAFIQNDGSLGVHNYAYTDALLDGTARLISQLSVPGANLQPTEAPAPTATPAVPVPITVGMELPARTGLRPMTFVWMGLAVVVVGGGSIYFLLRGRRRSRKQEKSQ